MPAAKPSLLLFNPLHRTTTQRVPLSCSRGLLHALIFAYARLWPPLQRAVVRSLVYLRIRLGTKHRNITARNIRFAFGLPEHSHFSRTMVQQVFRSQIQIGLEVIQEAFYPGKLQLHGLAELQAAVTRLEAADKGGIIVTAHLGSWDLVGAAVSAVSRSQLVAVAKPTKRRFLQQLLEELRQRMGMEVIWTHNSRHTLKQMALTLKRQQWLGFVMDQKPLLRSGPAVDFFATPTSFVSGPATMAIKFQAPVLAVFCVRTGPQSYRLLQREILPANHGVDDPEHLTQRFAHTIEEMIRLYPEQWCWDYKRWRLDA
ncbi:MAG: lysophospholipid acyltransferase family protein [Zetaproteobacteria bacterium]|nr:lysophospholipid acyltransferase family protein [Zetaproteobacteria bacterium]